LTLCVGNGGTRHAESEGVWGCKYVARSLLCAEIMCLRCVLVILQDLSDCRTMNQPPFGVGDVFSAVCVLLAGLPNSVRCALASRLRVQVVTGSAFIEFCVACSEGIAIDKKGRVRDKDREWGNTKKVLLTDVKGLIAALRGFKAVCRARSPRVLHDSYGSIVCPGSRTGCRRLPRAGCKLGRCAEVPCS
jgi:hypothetical protein